MPAGWDMPVQPMRVSKGENAVARSCSVEEAMSPARMETLRIFSEWIRAILEGSELWIVEGRSRTVMELRWGWAARALSTARPSSPAPRTRMGLWGGDMM